MAKILFPVADLGITIPGAPVVEATAAFPYAPSPISTAAGDWMLGPDADSLETFSGTATLTAQGTSHTWSDNYVTVAAAGAALASNILEATEQTFWVAFKYRTAPAKNSIIVGNIGTALTSGFAVTNTTTGQLRLTTYGSATNQANISSIGAIPTNLADGDWALAVISISASQIIRKMTGGDIFTSAFSNARTLNTANALALGNGYFTANTNYTPVDMSAALFGVINSALDDDGISDLYDALRKRLAYRDISVAA